MKILIVSTIVPYVEGGGTQIVDWLEIMLARAGHDVEVFRIPFHSSYREMPDQMLALRLFDLSEAADRLIAIRTPSYLLRHPNKVVWFIHHHRGAYDLWGTDYQDLPDTSVGRKYRDMFVRADNVALAEAQSIFANSRVVAKRLLDFNAVQSKVLYPPLLWPERFRCGSFDGPIVYVSRITPHKRQMLAAEALLHTSLPVRLLIIGPADSPEYVLEIQQFAAEHGLKERLTVRPEWITEEEKISVLADSRAALYLPYDEDSYGYSCLEAQHSSKAVITTTDSGGALELIQHEVNGLVVSADPMSIAAALDRLWADRELARHLGAAGPARIEELGISWDTVLKELLT